VHLTVLGCSGSVPAPAAPASGYLVEDGDERIVLDLGNGTLAALAASRDPFTVNGLLLSHLHPDHCADFAALTVLRRYHPNPPHDPRANRLAVHAPAEGPTRLAAAYAVDAAELATTDLTDVFRFHPLGDGTRTVAGFTVMSARVAHPCEAYGFRIERAGQALCYTGDSGPCAALVDLAQDADLLLAEATWTHAASRPANLHLSGRQAGELAAASGARRLILTHLAPWTDPAAVLAEAGEAFDGEITLARAGARYSL